LQIGDAATMSDARRTVYTIGHSKHSLDELIALLKKHGVTALADVRSMPYSRFNPQFNRDAMERDLKPHGIKYVFLGRELGARSDDPACYCGGRVQYRRLAQTALFRSGIERVERGAAEHRIALMCAEKEPLDCHRTLLVSRALNADGVAISHILADGRLESHGDAMLRLLDIAGLARDDLLRSQEELIAEALTRQEERVAYVAEELSAEAKEEAK
jgi:uncharacterized protein (DUF488 family)